MSYDYHVTSGSGAESRPPEEGKKKTKTKDQLDMQKLGKSVAKEAPQKKAPHPSPDQTDHRVSLGKGEVEEMVESVKKTSKSKSVRRLSPSRELPGQRVYQVKADILPWINNQFEAGRRANAHIYREFERLVDKQNLDPSVKEALLTTAAKQKEASSWFLLFAKEEQLARPEFSEDLSQPLLPDKEAVAHYKGISKDVESAVDHVIAEFAIALSEATLKVPGLPESSKESIAAFGKKMSGDARNLEGIKRFEIIHENPLWDPDFEMLHPMAFKNYETDQEMKGTSVLHLLGPGKSSQAPRNEDSKGAVAANFFRSTFSVKPMGGEEEKTVVDISRSAITVEFDQKDPEERAKCNLALVKQVAEANVGLVVNQLTAEEISRATNRDTPLTFKLATVNLLTPDILRSMAREHELVKTVGQKISHKMSGAPADDERALALENLAAHRALSGKAFEYTLRDAEGTPLKDAQGKEIKIWVKYDLRYFNIPSNTLYYSLPSAATDVPELKQANSESWKKLEKDVRDQIVALGKEMNSKNLSPTEMEMVKSLRNMGNEVTDLREKAMLKTLKAGKVDSQDPNFRLWQKRSDEWAKAIQTVQTTLNPSPDFQKQLDLLQKQRQLVDLYLDTRELMVGGLNQDLKNVDNNRSALATRLIYLNSLVEGGRVHFGCRSGKDRTGLVDIEVKLLATESALHGRIPSYREEERMSHINDHRETMTLQSGNTHDLVKAVMGAAVGLNSGGAGSDPLEHDDVGKQFEEFQGASRAFAEMASRPPAKGHVPPAFEEKWKERQKEGAMTLSPEKVVELQQYLEAA